MSTVWGSIIIWMYSPYITSYVPNVECKVLCYISTLLVYGKDFSFQINIIVDYQWDVSFWNCLLSDKCEDVLTINNVVQVLDKIKTIHNNFRKSLILIIASFFINYAVQTISLKLELAINNCT